MVMRLAPSTEETRKENEAAHPCRVSQPFGTKHRTRRRGAPRPVCANEQLCASSSAPAQPHGSLPKH